MLKGPIFVKIDEYNDIEWYRHNQVFDNPEIVTAWCAWLNGDCIMRDIKADRTKEQLIEIAQKWVKENW